MLRKDFKEFIESLNAHEVRYLVVGGYAVALHGHPRDMKDLDVWIETSPENAGKILNSLKTFGFESLDLTTADFLEADQIVHLGYHPHRIDILTTLKALRFENCYRRKTQITIHGTAVDFIDIDDLI